MSIFPNPQGRQKEVVYLDAEGHIVVLGSAGSGKTTMAIHRAIHLQKNHTEQGEKTLLVTFNKMLVEYMKSFDASLPAGLVIENYHKTTRGFLRSQGKMVSDCILNDKKPFIELALQEIKNQHEEPLLERPLSLFIEEIKWIEQFGIRSLEEYIKVERTGRSGKGTRIERSSRRFLWMVYERYRGLRNNRGYRYDWDDIGMALEDVVKATNSNWMYRHIVIDEGQDFSPTMIRSLTSAIPSNGSLTLFGDVAQQVYGVRISWKSAGLKDVRKWEFKENYRNTKEIAKLALALSEMSFFEDEPDLIVPNAPKVEGPKPALVKFASRISQTNSLVKFAHQYAQTQTVAILVRKRDSRLFEFISKLENLNARVTELHPERGGWLKEPGIMVGTYQSAKGLEFDTVFMLDCDQIYWPDGERIQEVGIDETSAEDARLLYVGITRARTQLIISFTQVMTTLLPQDMGLYNYREF